MKNRTAAVLVLAAALSFGVGAVPAMAAEGWSQEGGNWVYYDSNGSKVYNEWKKGATISGGI